MIKKSAFIDMHALFGFPLLYDAVDACVNDANIGFVTDLTKKKYNVFFMYDHEAWAETAQMLSDTAGADGAVLSPEYVEHGTYAGLAEYLECDSKRSFYILGRRESVDLVRQEGLKAHYTKIRQPFSLVKTKDVSVADEKEKKKFSKLLDGISHFERYLETGVVYALNFPRMLALDGDDLVRTAPDDAIDIIVGRWILEGGVAALCNDPQQSHNFVQPVPEKIDFATCRRLEIVETKTDMLVRLCDETQGSGALYQTAITTEAWENRKDLFFGCVRKMRQAFAEKKPS